MTLEYKQSLKEVDMILNIMGNVPINEQLLKNDTRLLLSIIYRNYWCNEEKKKKLLKEDALLKFERGRKIREKYNPDNIFNNKQQNIISEESLVNDTSMAQYKESIFKKILNKIKYVLKTLMKK